VALAAGRFPARMRPPQISRFIGHDRTAIATHADPAYRILPQFVRKKIPLFAHKSKRFAARN
jgi:hypothetical protein